MHLKLNRYCFEVVLVYTIFTLTFPSGRGDPVLYPAHIHNVRRRVLPSQNITTHHPPGQGDRQRRHPDPRPGQESTHLHENLRRVEDKELGLMRTSVGMGHHIDQTLTVDGEQRRSSVSDLRGDCREGERHPVLYGGIYRRTSEEMKDSTSGYQPGHSVPVQTGEMEVRGERISWQRLQPVVECGDKIMTLVVRRRWAAQLLLHRVNESSVPLSRLPPDCGYSVETSRRYLTLKAQYDACHVTQEGGGYVLPLLWRGSPVQMFCPVPQVQSEVVDMPSLCCSPHGITVIVQGVSVTEEPSINVRGEWTPVAVLAEECGYTVDRQDAEIVITAPFMTCGITVKDGKYTLSLQTGVTAFTLSCPFSPTDLQQEHQPYTSSPYHSNKGQNEHMPKTPGPFRWGPPFYLAPPHYPHPPHAHKYPHPDMHDDPQPQPHNPGYYFQQLPVAEHLSVPGAPSSADELKDSTQVYTERQQRQPATVSRVSEKPTIAYPTTSPSGQIEVHPSHPFNPYYHYYHHPKIPLRGPPQDPDPGPDETASVVSSNPDSALLSSNVQLHEAHSRGESDHLDQPLPNAHPYPHPSETHSPQPHPPHYYYFPHYAVSDGKNSPSAAASNLNNHQNTKYSSLIHPFPHSAAAAKGEKYNLNPHTSDSSPDLYKHTPEWIIHPLWMESEDDQTSQSGHLVKPPHLQYPSAYPYTLGHNPSDYYFRAQYGCQTSFKGAADPPIHYPSNRKPPLAPHDDERQTTTPAAHTQSMYDADISLENLHYHDPLYQLPQVSINHHHQQQQLYPAVSMTSGNEAAKETLGLFSNYDDGEVDWFGHAAEHQDPGFPQTLYVPQAFTQQLSYDLFEHDGQEVEMPSDLEIGGEFLQKVL